jgi:hypothetical protein
MASSSPVSLQQITAILRSSSMSIVAQSFITGIRTPMSRRFGFGLIASPFLSHFLDLPGALRRSFSSRASSITRLEWEENTKFCLLGPRVDSYYWHGSWCLLHQDRLYFLFGDTWRVGHSTPNDDLYAIAFSTDMNANDGLELAFLPRPPLVPGITSGAFEVPLDGVSWNGSMYAFFSTDHRRAGIYTPDG